MFTFVALTLTGVKLNSNWRPASVVDQQLFGSGNQGTEPELH